MTSGMTIALDAMGGDFGPSVVVPAALEVLKACTPGHLSSRLVRLVLVGDEAVLDQEVKRAGANWSDGLACRHASENVEMDELPSQALRNKKNSSMRVCVDLVKEGIAQACVSAGNTGALMATSRFVLKTLPGVSRPAIVSALPSVNGHTHVLDLGANVDTSAQQLLEFAVMGSVLAAAVDDVTEPTVALLNIGQEEIKGNDQVREAATMLAASPLNYNGFVEGDDIFKGTANVVVCDGVVEPVDAIRTRDSLREGSGERALLGDARSAEGTRV